jgi:hypothetical protein
MERTYLSEFPNYDDALPAIDGFKDSSWHNDACPSLTKELGSDRFVQLWCDYKSPDLSEKWGEEMKRYLLVLEDGDGGRDFLIETDNLEEVKNFIKGSVWA